MLGMSVYSIDGLSSEIDRSTVVFVDDESKYREDADAWISQVMMLSDQEAFGHISPREANRKFCDLSFYVAKHNGKAYAGTLTESNTLYRVPETLRLRWVVLEGLEDFKGVPADQLHSNVYRYVDIEADSREKCLDTPALSIEPKLSEIEDSIGELDRSTVVFVEDESKYMENVEAYVSQVTKLGHQEASGRISPREANREFCNLSFYVAKHNGKAYAGTLTESNTLYRVPETLRLRWVVLEGLEDFKGVPADQLHSNVYRYVDIEADSREKCLDTPALSIEPKLSEIEDSIGELDRSTVVFVEDESKYMENVEAYVSQVTKLGHQEASGRISPREANREFCNLSFYVAKHNGKAYVGTLTESNTLYKVPETMPLRWMVLEGLEDFKGVPADQLYSNVYRYVEIDEDSREKCLP